MNKMAEQMLRTEWVYSLIIENHTGHIENIVEFEDGVFRIGRHCGNDIRLSSTEVSRNHAEIFADNGKIYISDLGSKSGTFFNEKPVVDQQKLPSGAIALIGSYRLHFNVRKGAPDGQKSGRNIRALDLKRMDLDPALDSVATQIRPLDAQIADSARVSVVPIEAEASPKTKIQPLVEEGVNEGSVIKIQEGELLASGFQGPSLLLKSGREGSKDSLFERYEKIRLLGKGAYGSIWVVQDRLSGRYVALKILKDRLAHNEKIVHQFMLEGIIAARLKHPNILPVHEVGLDNNQPYYTMVLVEGLPAKQIILGADMRKSISIIAQAAKGVAYAHKQNLMHLDLKPGNLLIDNTGHCYVTDWGLVRVIPGCSYNLEIPSVVLPYIQGLARGSHDSRDDSWVVSTLTKMDDYFSSKIAGTWRYMAPEQASGRPGAASDLWALGLMLYEALTGVHPYKLIGLHQEDIPAIRKVKSLPPVAEVANRTIPFPRVTAICDRALRRGGQQPFPDVESFADALSIAIGIDHSSHDRKKLNKSVAKRQLQLVTQLTTLPFYKFQRRREIEAELAALQEQESESLQTGQESMSSSSTGSDSTGVEV